MRTRWAFVNYELLTIIAILGIIFSIAIPVCVRAVQTVERLEHGVQVGPVVHVVLVLLLILSLAISLALLCLLSPAVEVARAFLRRKTRKSASALLRMAGCILCSFAGLISVGVTFARLIEGAASVQSLTLPRTLGFLDWLGWLTTAFLLFPREIEY